MTAGSPTDAPFPFRGSFLLDPAARARYAAAAGILTAIPRAVAIPADRRDVQSLVRWAAATRTPLIPRSAGTGMPGGNVGEGVAVDLLTSFSRIRGPEEEAPRMHVEVGATLASVNEASRPHKLIFPVDPSSGESCTFGGMLANNSGGPHSVRHGSTRSWVHELEIVLADGSLVRTARGEPPRDASLAAICRRLDGLLEPHRETVAARWPRVRKNSSGYALSDYLRSGDLIDLLIGSEGTLCLMLSATVGLTSAPVARGLVVLEFTDLERAGEAVQSILREDPATCEMMDRTFLELVRNAGRDEGYPLRPGLEAILLVEMEGSSSQEVAGGLQRVARVAQRLGSRHTIAAGEAEQRAIWTLRRAASPIIAEQSGGRVSMQFIEDCVVPVEQLARYVQGLRAILARHELPAVIFGHAGDANLHVNPLVDVRAAGWQSTLEQVLQEVAELVAALGGTLSGEHGDGRLRAPLLQVIWGEEMVDLFRQVKNIFDPAAILNPGVILPLPGQRPFDSVRSYA